MPKLKKAKQKSVQTCDDCASELPLSSFQRCGDSWRSTCKFCLRYPACYICQEQRVTRPKWKLCDSCQGLLDQHVEKLRADFKIHRMIQSSVKPPAFYWPPFVNWEEEWEKAMSSSAQQEQDQIFAQSCVRFE